MAQIKSVGEFFSENDKYQKLVQQSYLSVSFSAVGKISWLQDTFYNKVGLTVLFGVYSESVPFSLCLVLKRDMVRHLA